MNKHPEVTSRPKEILQFNKYASSKRHCKLVLEMYASYYRKLVQCIYVGLVIKIMWLVDSCSSQKNFPLVYNLHTKSVNSCLVAVARLVLQCRCI